MNKFATFLLKVIMIISFVGIIVFVTFAIISNQNITFEAYNYISSSYENLNFVAFENNVNANVKTSYNGETDSYARYVNKAINQLNAANNYFLNYLSCETGLNKGEQDKLKDLYDKYVAKFKIAKKAYDDYMVAYADADYQYNNNYDESSVSLSIVIAKGVYFVERYTDCYVSGSKYFKCLVNLVNKYAFKSTQNFSFKDEIYIIKIGTIDATTDFVYSSMKNKKDNKAYETNARNHDLVDCFYDILSKEGNFYDENLIVNKNFQNFVFDLRKLNIFKWAGNFDAYKSSLKNEDKINACQRARDYFVTNFRG